MPAWPGNIYIYVFHFFMCWSSLSISNLLYMNIDECTLFTTGSHATKMWPEPITWSDTELEQTDLTLPLNDAQTRSSCWYKQTFAIYLENLNKCLVTPHFKMQKSSQLFRSVVAVLILHFSKMGTFRKKDLSVSIITEQLQAKLLYTNLWERKIFKKPQVAHMD